MRRCASQTRDTLRRNNANMMKDLICYNLELIFCYLQIDAKVWRIGFSTTLALGGQGGHKTTIPIVQPSKTSMAQCLKTFYIVTALIIAKLRPRQQIICSAIR